MTLPLSPIARQIAEFIRSTGDANPPTDLDVAFNRLICNLFAEQFHLNPAYRTFCQSQGVHRPFVENWTQIPCVPTTAFKDFEFTCLPPEFRTHFFLSSATTGQSRSQHFHDAESLYIYEASLKPWFRRFLVQPFDEDITESGGDDSIGMLALTPPPEQAPHSSLVHMLGAVQREFGSRDSLFVGKAEPDGSWRIDCDRLLFALRKSMCANRPLLILGTAFNWVEMLDYLANKNIRYRLADGTRAMETGGYKGRSREMPKEDLYRLLRMHLRIQPDRIVGEYGMSELSSQAYETREANGAGSGYLFPPWVRTRIISPETGRATPVGEPGLLQIFDLANIASACAIQTGDLAVAHTPGCAAFHLIGRAPKTEIRGCSLMTADGGERISQPAIYALS
jgi:acyl-CoA synthetase (AMP-forming)/AMP-acid ligase II